MEVNKILKMDCSENEKLGMLFSARMDAMNVFEEGCGAVTIKAWDNLFQDLISWKNAPEKTTSNIDYPKCKHKHRAWTGKPLYMLCLNCGERLEQL